MQASEINMIRKAIAALLLYVSCMFPAYVMRFAAFVPGATMNVTLGPYRVSLSGTTTIFAVADCIFTVSSWNAWGQFRARRVR
jgi:hypothetical protein